MLEELHVENFTAFHELHLKFGDGVNIFIGPNGTGKTHILKLAYAICAAHRDGQDYAEKLIRVFLPFELRLGRLVRRKEGAHSASVSLQRDGHRLRFGFSSNQGRERFAEFHSDWAPPSPEDGIPIFIPVKEMLAHAPGFRSLYSHREISFEETYRDILEHAYLPPARGAPDAKQKDLLKKIEKLIDGQVTLHGEQFFLKNAQGELEFSLLAEGFRKFALLLVLIRNRTLRKSSVLFWDEPEANINPAAIPDLVAQLLQLKRQGVQLFLATHSDYILKELDVQQQQGEVRYFSLYEQEDRIAVEMADRYDALAHNVIEEENLRLYDEEVARALGKQK